MAQERSRYFHNPFPRNGSVKNDSELQKSRIMSCIESIRKNIKPASGDSAKGLYTGTSGVAYAFYYLAKCNLLPECNDVLLSDAEDYISVALDEHNISSRRHIGLLSGNSGIYAVAALIFYKRGNNQDVIGESMDDRLQL